MPAKSALIAVLIMGRPVCLECLCAKTELSASEVNDYLAKIATHLQLHREESDHCRVCGQKRSVVSLLRVLS
jgi:hypothetical protein